MSFSFNPFRYIALIQNDPDDPEAWSIHCEGCGMISRITFGPNDEIQSVVQLAHDHIRHSHKRSPEDFKGRAPS